MVSSHHPLEVQAIRKEMGDDFLIVTPWYTSGRERSR